MKILTKEEEEEHYYATVVGGLKGGLLGLVAGATALYAGKRKFQTINDLTLQMKAFLITSSGTFTAIVNADRASRNYEKNRHPFGTYRDVASLEIEQLKAQKPIFQRIKDWGGTNRYSIVTVSWLASMGTAFTMINRNKYLTRAQKIVQARIYAQGLTLAVLIATAAFEVRDANSGKGRWETVKVLDPNDPNQKNLIEKRVHHEAYAGEDLWKDMVAAEERQIETRQKTNVKQRKPDDSGSSSSITEDR